MIEVFGIPILNKPHLLQGLFNTIDEPIGRLFVVDNGGIVKGSNLQWPWDVQSVHVTDPGWNMGVAASWNTIIKANMNAPYWVISNVDMILEAGALKRLSEAISEAQGPCIVRIQNVNEDWGNHFGTFAVNAEAIEKVGWFDENLHPIYFEDTDWLRRAERLDIQRPVLRSTSLHAGNSSWKDDANLAADNKVSWDGNVEYFDDKWSRINNGLWHKGESLWNYPSLNRLRRQAWHVERKDSGPI